MTICAKLINLAESLFSEPLHIEARALLKHKFLALTFALAVAAPVSAQTQPQDLSKLSVEDLMNIEVTSVSKKEQKLSRIASAIFVITQDDIQRSGATNIPDLLRMVPGLDVAQIYGSAWEISSRGFNSQFANKLLVLIDGRTVYSPLFAGVYWDVQDVPLEDIDRIEVIRGPGATVWGANAVNGVINIITKSAKETQGGLLTAGGGTHEPGFGVAQYGGKLIRRQATVFLKGFDYNPFPSLSGQDGHDGSHLLHGGFRVDSTLSKQDSLTVLGDLYEGRKEKVINTVALTPPFGRTVTGQSTTVSGGNVGALGPHLFVRSQIQACRSISIRQSRSRDRRGREGQYVRHRFSASCGLGKPSGFCLGRGLSILLLRYDSKSDAFLQSNVRGPAALHPFVQDEITLKPDRFYLTIGAKLEHNDFSGFEFQPSARIAWNVNDQYVVGRIFPSQAHSFACRQAIRIAIAAFPGPGGLPALLTVDGSPNAVSENLDAFDTGYRIQLRPNISLDLAGFYNRYEDLNTFEPGTPFLELNPPPPHLNVPPTVLANQMYGEAHGLEMAVNWKVTNRWTLSSGYAFERIHLHRHCESRHDLGSNRRGKQPTRPGPTTLDLALSRSLEWNTSVYFVGRLLAEQVPSYTRLDTGITWRASEYLAISLVGQNLLKDHHVEYQPDKV